MKLYPLMLTALLSFSTQADDALEQGKALYLSPGKGGCASCHGPTGNEPVMPMYPKLGGQMELYTFNQLNDYKNKKRKNGLFIPMEVAMESYSEEETQLIAKFLASQGNR